MQRYVQTLRLELSPRQTIFADETSCELFHPNGCRGVWKKTEEKSLRPRGSDAQLPIELESTLHTGASVPPSSLVRYDRTKSEHTARRFGFPLPPGPACMGSGDPPW